jgi:RNA polymerase sigma-70 factor, ECF subfamily
MNAVRRERPRDVAFAPDGARGPSGLSGVVAEWSNHESVSTTSYRERADQLYREYGPMVYRRCLRLLRDREAARDATQEVFVKLLRDIEKLDSRETALPWAYRVATNYCLNLRRDARRHREEALEPELDVRPAAAPPGYPDLHLAQAVLSRFDAQTQAVAVGVFVDGMEHEEVAELLGISRRTVSRKLDRFLENAKKFLARSEP